MKTLLRYFKILSNSILWLFLFIVIVSNVYASDNSLDLTVTNFLDSLSYNYKGFNIKVTGVAIEETYDDNIIFSDEDELDDFITELRAGVGVKYEDKTKKLDFIGVVNNQTFAKNSDFSNVAEDVILNFKNEFSKYDRVTLTNIFTHSEAPLISSLGTDFLEEQFLRKREGRLDVFTNRFNINYSRDLSRKLSVFALYGNAVSIFSGADIENSFLNEGGFGTGYVLSPTTSFSLSYRFTHREFEDDADASLQTIAPGIRYNITKKLYFDGRAGIVFIESFDDTSHTLPIARASLTYQRDPDTLASLTIERRNETDSYNEDVTSSTVTSATLSRQLLERFRASISFFYGQGETISSDSEFSFLGANTTLSYDINKNLKGNLTYTYSDFDPESETGGGGYTKNTVILGLSASF